MFKFVYCVYGSVYERLRGYCTFSLTERERAKLNCCGTSLSAAFFPFSSPTKKHGRSLLRGGSNPWELTRCYHSTEDQQKSVTSSEQMTENVYK